jgi:hypothetical protein
MLRAAAYIAKIQEASVGTVLVGNIEFGLTIPAIENPLAIKTFVAVTSEATRILVASEVSGIIKRISPKNWYHAARRRTPNE